MKKIVITLLIAFCSQFVIAQNNSGIITYERKVFWINIMSKLPWITQEDIDRDRLTWGKNQGKYGQPYLLYFTPTETFYTAKEVENETGYSWKKEEFSLYRDYKKKTSKDLVETLGKKYLVEDEVPVYTWKILNEIKEVQGYLCMKAETTDTVKNQVIHAWFTDGIPAEGGPEGFGGLPGMILEVNIDNGSTIISATKVDISENQVDIPIPKKWKGKKKDRSEFNQIIASYIQTSYDAKRNPFWSIRF